MKESNRPAASHESPLNSGESLARLIKESRDKPIVDEEPEAEWMKGRVRLEASVGSIRQKPGKGHDRVFLAPNRGVFVVNDGVGGSYRGDIAATVHGQACLESSRLSITDPYAFFEGTAGFSAKLLSELRRANHWTNGSETCSIGAYAHPTPEPYVSYGKRLFRTHVTLALVGDCQAYKLRPNGEVIPLFRPDRPRVDPLLSEYQAIRHPNASDIGASICDTDDAQAAVEAIRFEDVRLDADEVLLLATDGLSNNRDASVPFDEVLGALSPERLAQFITSVLPSKQLEHQLMTSALPKHDLEILLRQRLSSARSALTGYDGPVEDDSEMDVGKLWRTKTLSDCVRQSFHNRRIDLAELKRQLDAILDPSTMRQQDDGAYVIIAPRVQI